MVLWNTLVLKTITVFGCKELCSFENHGIAKTLFGVLETPLQISFF
jgi:hypothetical protein